ncbi:hypothetical protein CONLIGDRAFT_353303 [Coniochaeta ligniaria NRRL 30616]|uniref:Uncharacterized protein n=1 Tax=Coniochaeta ligniaria NRRL 30616 TaxID=1408157 RepID=A0A1J7JQE0_9PEZI|nr:hypothetical protein CONLIGDRAFT_353303 [Coniochaeta ligniaria NRRL 30616]
MVGQGQQHQGHAYHFHLPRLMPWAFRTRYTHSVFSSPIRLFSPYIGFYFFFYSVSLIPLQTHCIYPLWLISFGFAQSARVQAVRKLKGQLSV